MADLLIEQPTNNHIFSDDHFGDDHDESRRDQEKLDLVELLEAVTYLVCQDNHVVPDTFYKVANSLDKKHSEILNKYFQIWSSRGVVTKLMRCIDKAGDDITTVEEFMSFVIVITNPL